MSDPHKMADRLDPTDSASLKEKINSLRKVAEDGELGDELLEDVAGGGVFFCDMVIHTDSHTDSIDPD
jgi:hypothetical protein